MTHGLPKRSRVLPRRSITADTLESAASFVERMGRLLYEEGWDDAARSMLNNPTTHAAAGSAADVAGIVRDQVLLGLQEGRFTAAIRITAASWEQARHDPLMDEEWPTGHELLEALTEDGDPVRGEDNQPKLREFIVAPTYWCRAADEICVDWLSSEITISAADLIDELWAPRRGQDIRKTYNIPDKLKRYTLLIRSPYQKFSDFIVHADVPEPEWGKRYTVYVSKGRFEALAFMWRYLAIGIKNNESRPSAKMLAEAASNFLVAHGLKSPPDRILANKRDPGLEKMAVGILKQFDELSRDSSLFVTSTPGAL